MSNNSIVYKRPSEKLIYGNFLFIKHSFFLACGMLSPEANKNKAKRRNNNKNAEQLKHHNNKKELCTDALIQQVHKGRRRIGRSVLSVELFSGPRAARYRKNAPFAPELKHSE